MLLLLVTSQRGQTIVNLSLEGMEVEKDSISFRLSTLLKHNRPGDPLDSIVLTRFKDKLLCVVRTLKCYIKKTQDIRKEEKQLLISYVSPHHGIGRDTLARWTLSVLSMAGINTLKYRSHSTRGASASAARACGVNLNTLMKHAGWKSQDLFAKFYNKRIDRDPLPVQNILLKGTT